MFLVSPANYKKYHQSLQQDTNKHKQWCQLLSMSVTV